MMDDGIKKKKKQIYVNIICFDKKEERKNYA
jgi:hypothetical protein